MKKIFTLCFSIISVSLFAQPTLNSSEMATPGMVFTYKHVASFGMIDTNVVGSGRTWDFSSATATADPDYINTIIDPSVIAEADSFPGANWGLEEGPGEYYFFNKTASIMERLGSYDPVDGYRYYTNTQIEYMFPMSYPQTFSDISVSGNNGSFTQGTYDYACLGDGSLITPNHTYPSVLMSRITLDIGFIAITSYIWYDADNGMPVFNYIPGDGIIIDEGAIWLNSVSTGIDETVFGDIQFNNPVTSDLTVRFLNSHSGMKNYTLTNVRGQVVTQGEFNRSEQSSLTIDMKNEPAGIYFLTINELSGKGKKSTLKIVKLQE